MLRANNNDNQPQSFLVDVELLVWEAGERASKRGAVTKDPEL
jgi:hypothetical protein